jgi:hypothetical protein
LLLLLSDKTQKDRLDVLLLKKARQTAVCVYVHWTFCEVIATSQVYFSPVYYFWVCLVLAVSRVKKGLRCCLLGFIYTFYAGATDNLETQIYE